MERLTDDAWLSRARDRLAQGGSWESPPAGAENPESEPGHPSPEPAIPEPESGGPRCPYCSAHGSLTVFPRYESGGNTPLLYCPACYGFWARGDCLALGVADPMDESPALYAHTAPRRCRACGGRLRDDETCVKCGQALPKLDCPACGREMVREKQRGVTLDVCGPCGGAWFDTGELAAAYGLQPPQSLSASTVDDDGPSDGDLMMQAAGILLGGFLG
jgi:Zn-finger nucleic acid-binding protein